jgi:hypothetical protein
MRLDPQTSLYGYFDMANTVITPNMLLPTPVPSVDPGPDYAVKNTACFNVIDGHNHSPNSGVQITPAGINISTDLPFNGNNATLLRSSRYSPQTAPLNTPADINELYVSGVDLYYNDGNGKQIPITSMGTVTGAAGTITGLPSGTASASYAGSTFTFQSATSTPATMNVGSVIIGREDTSNINVTISASSSQAADYDLTLPPTAPAANQVPISDGSGNLSWSWGLLPLGSVIATFPNLTGAYSTSATTVADAHGFVLCVGQTLADSSSPMNGAVVPNINNSVFLLGNTTAGTTGGSATSSGVGAHTHTFTSSTTVASNSHTHVMSHYHQWAYQGGVSSSSNDLLSIPGSEVSVSNVTYASGSPPPGFTQYMYGTLDVANSTGSNFAPFSNTFSGIGWYTTGSLGAPSGSDGASSSTGTPSASTTVSGTTNSTGSSFSILPPYISAVYLMRAK